VRQAMGRTVYNVRFRDEEPVGSVREVEMHKLFGGIVAIALLLAVSAPAFAKTESVTGKVVDMNCYVKDKANNAGVDHKMPADTKGCAVACAKKGQPLALLTADGKVYEIAGGLAENNNAKLVPHIAHTVMITGDTMDTNGKMMIHASDLKMVSK
jgi:hypothetical protein